MGAPKFKLLKTPMRKKNVRREDVLTEVSKSKGLVGLLETFLRRFRNVSFALLLSPLALVCCTALGLAVAPALFWFRWVDTATAAWPVMAHYAAIGFAASSGFVMYGICLIFVVPAINFLIPLKVKEFRGPWYSLPAIPWYVHNGLTYMVRYTFLEFVTPSPLNILFYRMMGMKIGKGVVINTANISDPCLITLGDYVTVGGSATIFAHYGQKGYLVIAPVTIGNGTNIGLKASIMGGSTVGENVTILPHSVVMPKSKIANGKMV